jgi:hypothetical protein
LFDGFFVGFESVEKYWVRGGAESDVKLGIFEGEFIVPISGWFEDRFIYVDDAGDRIRRLIVICIRLVEQ